MCLKVGVSIINSDCYWLVRNGGTASCNTQCNNNYQNIAQGNGGNGIPNPLQTFFFMCSDGTYADQSNAISISLDGETIDPALVVASNNGAMTVSTCSRNS